MWYYGCILFALSFAAVCAAMAIIKFYRQQDYFTGTLNMTRQQVRQQAGLIFPTHGQYAQKTTVIIRKVVLRCICYPLSKHITINIISFYLDSCLSAYRPDMNIALYSSTRLKSMGCGNSDCYD